MKPQQFIQKQRVLVKNNNWEMWELKYYVSRLNYTTQPHVVTDEPSDVILRYYNTEEEKKCDKYSYCIDATDTRCSGRSLVERIIFSKDSPFGDREIEGRGDVFLEKKQIDNGFWIVENKITDFGVHEIARHNLKHIESYWWAMIQDKNNIINFGDDKLAV